MSIQNKKGIKILLCPDKFKGSLTSAQAANSIKNGLLRGADALDNSLELSFRSIAIADGGDGSQEVIEQLYNARKIAITTYDAVGRCIESEYLIYESGGRTCAFIEMAKICGLAMLEKDLRNPLYTTTYGLGVAIKDAADKGVDVITLSIGGSATNDGGIGLLQALEFNFYSQEGAIVKGSAKWGNFLSGSNLSQISKIESKDSVCLNGIEFRVICDVNNPLLGNNGATYVFGPQKGADEAILKELEAGMESYVKANNNVAEYANTPGAGAAGGVGFACVAYLGARLISGWRFFAELTQLKQNIEWADLVITGEGRIDSQSLQGKVIDGVITIAKEYHKKVVAFCGISLLEPQETQKLECYQIVSIESNVENCMANANELLQELAFRASKNLL